MNDKITPLGVILNRMCEVGDSLHFVDGFDEVEERFGALGLVGDFASSAIGWI